MIIFRVTEIQKFPNFNNFSMKFQDKYFISWKKFVCNDILLMIYRRFYISLKSFKGPLLEIILNFHLLDLSSNPNFISSNFTCLKKRNLSNDFILKCSSTKIKLGTKYHSYRNPLRSSGRIFTEDDSNWITLYFAWCCFEIQSNLIQD